MLPAFQRAAEAVRDVWRRRRPSWIPREHPDSLPFHEGLRTGCSSEASWRFADIDGQCLEPIAALDGADFKGGAEIKSDTGGMVGRGTPKGLSSELTRTKKFNLCVNL